MPRVSAHTFLHSPLPEAKGPKQSEASPTEAVCLSQLQKGPPQPRKLDSRQEPPLSRDSSFRSMDQVEWLVGGLSERLQFCLTYSRNILTSHARMRSLSFSLSPLIPTSARQN